MFAREEGLVRCCWNTPTVREGLGDRDECPRYPDPPRRFVAREGAPLSPCAAAPFPFVSADEPFPFRASEKSAVISSPLISPWYSPRFPVRPTFSTKTILFFFRLLNAVG